MAGGILFDLDETLIDRATSISRYAARFHSDFVDDIRVPSEAFVAEFLRLDGNGYVPRNAFFDSLARYISSPRVRPDDIASHFGQNAWTKPILMPGAQEGLQCLRREAIPAGIVTNGGSMNQRKKFVSTGLDQLVDHFVVSEECGSRKPDAAIFSSACEALRIEPDASWFVGDNPVVDIAGAAAVGFKTIWLKRSMPWPERHPACYTQAVSTLQEAFDAIHSDA